MRWAGGGFCGTRDLVENNQHKARRRGKGRLSDRGRLLGRWESELPIFSGLKKPKKVGRPATQASPSGPVLVVRDSQHPEKQPKAGSTVGPNLESFVSA